MAISVKVKVTGISELKRMMKHLPPKQNQMIFVKPLLDCAHLIQTSAKFEQIIPGGRFFTKGPRGGKVLKDRGADQKRLTSRSNVLRDSISVNRQPLPFAIEVGTHIEYGPVHELGLGPYPKRPFLKPAVKATEKRFPEIFMSHWRKEAGV